MQDFELIIPTKIIFGEGVIDKIGESAKTYGKKVMMISYSKSILEEIYIYKRIMDSLKKSGLQIVEYFGVKSNPVVSHVRKGIKLAKEKNVDVLLAIGGGSVIDETKAIAAGTLYSGDVWDFFSGEAEIKDALPLVTLLTIPATSSEMNSGAVITNQEIKRKVGFFNPFFFPKISILDPTVTYSIGPTLTAYSAADILSHLLEGYLTHKDEWAPIQDGLMEVLMRTVIKSTERILINPKDYQGRATLMWAGSLSWNGLPVAGVGVIGYPMHMFEHSLSAFYDIHHGAGMSVIMPGWMEYDCNKNNRKYILLSKNVFGLKGKNNNETAKLGIKALKEWFIKIGTPTSFKSANLLTDELDKLADDVMITAKVWGMENWYSREQIIEIFKGCLD